MESITFIEIILGLVSFIVLIISGGVKMLWSKVNDNDKKIEKVRDNTHEELKEIYQKHDNSTDKVRTEINSLATSLRKDMAVHRKEQMDHNTKTTELLMQIAQKGVHNGLA